MGNKRLDASRIITKLIPIDLIDDHPSNYNVHPDAQVVQLAESHATFGQYRSIVVWERPNGRYVRVVGHGYSHGAKQQGETMLRAEVLPEDTSPETIKAIMIADNLHAHNSEPDETLLAELLQEQANAGYDLASLGSDEEALRQMLQALGDEILAGDEAKEEEDEDTGEEPNEEQTRVKVGDVWALGRHVIACIDSCDKEAVKKLLGERRITYIWSDPPYGISIVATNEPVGGGEAYDIPFGGVKNRVRGDVGGTAAHMRKTGKSYLEEWQERKTGLAAKRLGTSDCSKPFGSKAGKYAPIIGDDTTDTAVISAQMCLELFPDALQIWWGANYYADALPPSSCWIVWDKENTGNFADAELAWCSHKSAVRIFKHMWNGMLKASEHGQRRIHPSQKPVALCIWSYEKYGKEDDVIYDPFLGSGISVIAAERLPGNRMVIGCELSAAYIDKVISRWEAETGQTATLLDRMEVASYA